MANEEALQFLTKQITGLQMISQELSRIYTGITDLDLADEVRSQVTSINEVLFALQSARNSMEAASTVIQPPSEDRVQALMTALHQLDAYVRSDQNIHMALNYLTQVASLIRGA
jgi:hypothetical protein